MARMYITKTDEDRYYVEVRDPFIHEAVNASQFLAMAGERTVQCPPKKYCGSLIVISSATL